MEEILVIGVLILIGYLIYKIYKLKEDYNSLQNNYQRTKTLCEAQQKEISRLKYLEEKETELSTATEQVEKLERYKATLIERMGMYIESKCESYPHLSGLMADMLTRHYDKSAAYLAHKEKPAIEEAKRIKELKLETKEIISEKKTLEYKLAYIRSVYPNVDKLFDSDFELSSADLSYAFKLKGIIDQEEQMQVYDDQIKELKKRKESLVNEMEDYISQKCKGYHHLAGTMADILTKHYDESAIYLEHKDNPAKSEAKRIKELKRETKVILTESKILEYKLAYIRSLYPNIDDIFDDAFESSDFELETEETTDRVRLYLDPEEYSKLSPTERNQLALDKYIQGNKTKWQIGRDYELYIGYLCEQRGYKVEYTGISLKLEDMGRDLIVYDQLDTYIIQCKNWSQESEIHEKHIFQLYGSVVLYKIEHPFFNVKAVFVTTTQLSAKAKQFAEALDIEVKNVKMNEFPRIKCNIGKDANGRMVKIYHLPFDQQYDKTQIVNEGEMLATTVAEAENAGFRRAYRWHGTHT